MRIALVCDWLTEKGGAEKVLLELHKMYPEAPIYTSQYRPKRIDWFKDAKVKAGWLNIFPASFRKILGPLRQSYFSHLDLSDYDLIISVTGAEAKGIKLRTRKYDSDSRPGQYEVVLPPQDDPIHICYCHAPTQYYWQKYDEYLENPGFGKLNSIVRFFFKLFVKPLRRADYRAATRPDQFITISNDSADAIAEYYQRDSIIVAPPVEIEKFSTTFPQISSNSPQDQSKNPQNTESNPQEIHNGRELFHKKSTR